MMGSICLSFNLILVLLHFRAYYSATLNATGATFPNAVYQESTFSYRFASSDNDDISYSALGSTTGKCNIMGYWHTGNTNSFLTSSLKTVDTAICTDKCTVAVCGNSSVLYPRFDKYHRRPLVHFSGSDSLLGAADYTAFPDLLMLPSVAGAVVPIYNIPELNGYTLVLSRSTVAAIFLGNIKSWNDPRLLRDNTGVVKTILSGLQQKIQVVVRTDSSGTTEMFSTAVASFDPCCVTTPDYSFATRVGKGQTPKWCGPLTDEIQIITTSNCLSNSMTYQYIKLAVVGTNSAIRPISFPCNGTANEVLNAFQSVYGQNSIKVTRSSASASSFSYTIGYYGTKLTTKNMYQPYPYTLSSPNSVSVQITTLQEGGYWNSHYNSSAYTITKEMQSLWINTAVNATFNISDPNSMTPHVTSTMMNPSTDNILSKLKSLLSSISPGLVISISKVVYPSSSWLELKLLFNTSSQFPKQPKLLQIHLSNPQLLGSVVMTRYQTAYNYPLFYDNLHPQGYSGSGTYTCYKREHNYTAWSYHTGSGNKGVIAEVVSIPYAIGYSDLVDATTSNVARASIINKAGKVVVASGASVTYAAMELGGSLDSRFNAILADGASAKCWPMTGYTYFIIRTQHHLGTCEKRKEAMKFLYNFYYSDTVTQIALRLGYGTLPNFIRNIVVSKLVSTVQCSNGEYALEEYRSSYLKMITTATLYESLSTYLSAYYNIDSSTTWNLTESSTSNDVWKTYSSTPDSFAGAFTMFLSSDVKHAKYTSISKGGLSTLTTAFAHVAVVPVYHLSAYTAKSKVPLQVTAEILAKIYTGDIRYWNDSLIQLANYQNRKYLPYQRIFVVVRSLETDVNNIFTRYLAHMSSDFQSKYKVVGKDGISVVNYNDILPSNYTIYADDNTHVDSFVTHYDGSIGYYLQTSVPVSTVAYFCRDASCSNPIAPNAVTSLSACESDPSTIVTFNSNIVSYDLMFSNSTKCYPILGTIDYTVVVQDDSSTCSAGSQGMAYQRIEFSSWLFNGSAMVSPLESTFMKGSNNGVRAAAMKKYCDVKCSDNYLGYEYCNYRDCTWSDGDYIQQIDTCSASTNQRKVTYTLTSNNTCISGTAYAPKTTVYINCDYVMPASLIGSVCYAMCFFGVALCIILLSMAYYNRNERKFRKSQPIFVYIFLVGAMLMNLTVFVFVGQNTDVLCTLRPWLYNLSLTVMYGPLVMKLYTVDKLYHSTKISKVVNTEKKVIFEVAGMLLIDIIILGVWTTIETPRQIIQHNTYASVYVSVEDRICSKRSKSQMVMIVYKLVMLSVGMFKAITTWHVTAEISEAKQYSVAIAIGGIAYLMIIFVDYSTNSTVLLRCLGIFLSGTLSVCLIMIPKFAKKKYGTGAGAHVHPSSRNHPNANLSSVQQGGGPLSNQSVQPRSSLNKISSQISDHLKRLSMTSNQTSDKFYDLPDQKNPSASPMFKKVGGSVNGVSFRGGNVIDAHSVNDSIESKTVQTSKRIAERDYLISECSANESVSQYATEPPCTFLAK